MIIKSLKSYYDYKKVYEVMMIIQNYKNVYEVMMAI